MSQFFQGDPRALFPKGKCRHGVGGEDGRICRAALTKGPHPWQVIPKRAPVPPVYTLPYLGNWTPARGREAWDRFHRLHMTPIEPPDFNERNTP